MLLLLLLFILSVLLPCSKQSLFLNDKPSNLQKLTNWVNEDGENNFAEKRMNNNVENNWSDNNDSHENNSKLDQRNQHQKARCSA